MTDKRTTVTNPDGALLKTLEKHGCTVIAGSDGCERFTRSKMTLAQFVENVLGCDEGYLYVNTPEFHHFRKGRAASMYLVYGNSPGEIVCDYTDCESLNKATAEHYEKWDGTKQRTATRTNVFQFNS
jgi:hypothetical protein